MSVVYNGTTIDKIVYNGVEIFGGCKYLVLISSFNAGDGTVYYTDCVAMEMATGKMSKISAYRTTKEFNLGELTVSVKSYDSNVKADVNVTFTNTKKIITYTYNDYEIFNEETFNNFIPTVNEETINKKTFNITKKGSFILKVY